MSKYENRHHEIHMSAPVEWVEKGVFEKLWAELEAMDRFGNGDLASKGHEAIWDFERRCWIGLRHDKKISKSDYE